MAANLFSTPEGRKARAKAAKIVASQRRKAERDFNDRDRRLVSHIAKNLLNSSVLRASTDEALLYKLSAVERSLEARSKTSSKDAQLPDDAAALVTSLKRVMAFGGQSINKLRQTESSGMDLRSAQGLALELSAVADKLEELLHGL